MPACMGMYLMPSFFFMWMLLEHCFHYGRLFHISILYSHHITLPAKVHLVKAMVFPVVIYRFESWNIKKAKCQRITAFESWCWRRLFLRVPWTAGRSNQSILREINPEYSLEGLMLKLKLQYFGHLMRTADSLKKTLILGRIDRNRKRGQQRMRWLDSITDLMDMNLSNSMDTNLSKLQEMLEDRGACCATFYGVAKSHAQLSDWTKTSFHVVGSSSLSSPGDWGKGGRSCLMCHVRVWTWSQRTQGNFESC